MQLPKSREELDKSYDQAMERAASLQEEVMRVQIARDKLRKYANILSDLHSGWVAPYDRTAISVDGSSVPSACHFLLDAVEGGPVVMREFLGSNVHPRLAGRGGWYVYSREYCVARTSLSLVRRLLPARSARLQFPVVDLDAVLCAQCPTCDQRTLVVALFQYTGTYVSRRRELYPPQHREYFAPIEYLVTCCEKITPIF